MCESEAWIFVTISLCRGGRGPICSFDVYFCLEFGEIKKNCLNERIAIFIIKKDNKFKILNYDWDTKNESKF